MIEFFYGYYNDYGHLNNSFVLLLIITVSFLHILSFSLGIFAFFFQKITYFQKFQTLKDKQVPLTKQLKLYSKSALLRLIFRLPFYMIIYYYFQYFTIPLSYKTFEISISYIWKILLSLIIEDTFLYWIHRFLHISLIFSNFHKQTHFSKNICIIGENSHPFEIILIGLGDFIPIFIFSDHFIFLWIWLLIIETQKMEINCGYDIPYSLFNLLPGYIGGKYHDFHYKNNSNYSSIFLWWDAICGTNENYYDYLERLKQEKEDKINENLFYSKEKLQKIRKGKTLQMGPQISGKYSYVVTGGNGQVGKRLIKLLSEGGAKRITSLDVNETSMNERIHEKNITYIKCNILKLNELLENCKDHDIMIHTAALVGICHKTSDYANININGTKNVIEACKVNKIKALVLCSSTCTRIYDCKLQGCESSEMKYIEGKKWEHEYARTKALAEKAVLSANSEYLRTCSIAPHHIYGEDDFTSFPSMIREAKKGFLRVVGEGENIYSFVYVDNIAYAMFLAGNSLLGENYKDCAGKFYTVSDGPAHNFWNAVDFGVKSLGLNSIKKKVPLNKNLALVMAYIGEIIIFITGKYFDMNTFAIRRVINDFYFSIKEIQKDIGYEPQCRFEDKWPKSIQEVNKKLMIKKNKIN